MARNIDRGLLPMRTNAFDAVNGTAAAGFLGATVAGWTINELAAAAALFYSLLLIADKSWQLIKRWKSHRFEKKLAEPLDTHE